MIQYMELEAALPTWFKYGIELTRTQCRPAHGTRIPLGHETVFQLECKRGPGLDFELYHDKRLDFDASMIMNIRMAPKQDGDTTWSDRTNWEADWDRSNRGSFR